MILENARRKRSNQQPFSRLLKSKEINLIFKAFIRYNTERISFTLFLWKPVNSELRLAVLKFLRIFSLNCS